MIIPYDETFHMVISYFALIASIASVILFTYFFLIARSTRLFTVFAVGSAGLIIGHNLRNIVLLAFTGVLILFLAYAEKYYVGIRPIYWTLEALSMLIFLSAGVLAAILSRKGYQKINK